MNKKVRNAQLAQYIFIFGKMCRISEHYIFLRLYLYSSGWRNESSNKTVNVRTRDNKVHDEFTLEAVLDKSQELVAQRILKSEDYGWSPPTEEEGDKSKSATPVSE